MHLKIVGKLEKEKKNMLKEAVPFYANLLNLSPTLQKNIDLEIQLVPDLFKNQMSWETVLGWMIMLDLGNL